MKKLILIAILFNSAIAFSQGRFTIKSSGGGSGGGSADSSTFSTNFRRDSAIANVRVNLLKKYDSTQWVIATTQESVLNTASTGFVNFGNGGTLTYDGTNKRISVAVTAALQGVNFGPDLVAGHKYAVKINVTVNGATALILAQRYAYGYTNLYDGDNFTTFTADPGNTGLGKKMAVITNGGTTGTFYINFMQIKEIPAIEYPYATKGDISFQVANYRALGNVQIGPYANAGYPYASGLSYQIALGYNAQVYPLATSGIAIGVNSAVQGTGGIPESSIAIGDSTTIVSGRSVAIGGHARTDNVSTMAIGYGAYSLGPHGFAIGRGAYLDAGGFLFYTGGSGAFYFDAKDAKYVNPAMPGTGAGSREANDFSTALLAGTQVSTYRMSMSGKDATTSPTLTNIPGGIARIMAGQSTGTAAGGNLQLGITKAGGSSNNTLNSDFIALEISGVDGSTLIKKLKPSLTTTASASTITINSDTTTFYTVTALAANLTIANPTGTPNAGQKLMIRIKDNGTSSTLTFGSEFRFSSDLAAPSATTISKTLYMEFIRNSTDTKWDMVSKLDNF